MARISELFDEAVRYHQSGDLVKAEALCRQILGADPAHAAAYHLAGLVAHQAGRHQEAVTLLQQAIALNPADSSFHFNLAIVFSNLGRRAEAIACYRQGLRLDPQNDQAYNNLGNALKDEGQLVEAVECFRQTLRINPEHAAAYSNLGIVLALQGQLAQAVECYRRALRINPRYADAHYNLAIVLNDLGRCAEAAQCYREAVRLNPEHAAAHLNLGGLLQAQGHVTEAAECYREALRINPHAADACNNLGIVSWQQGQLDEALTWYRQAMAVKPDSPAFHSNLLHCLLYHPGYDGHALLQEHRRWCRRYAQPLAESIRPHDNEPAPERRLRIGYVSPDLREHPVGRFLLPLLEAHDHERFEIVCYSCAPRPDTITERCRAHADGWREAASLADEDLARLIRTDRIDVLVDLTMHMAGHRLLVFARKPAPVQVTYLAYCGTTGLRAMDYRLTDPYLDPPGVRERPYAEQSIWLPETYWCYRPAIPTPAAAPVPALGAGHVTFGCLNNFSKVTAPTLAAWSRVLQAVPRSRLLLHALPGRPRERVRDLMTGQGIAPERLTFVDMVPAADYYRLYERMDVALDPFPYGGGTTSCDALWMGVPLVSLVGATAVGRGGLSLLSNLGLADLAATDVEQYIRIAREIARNPARLSVLRATLRERMQNSPLMDAPRFARNVEAAYRDMWRTWCG